MVVGELWGVVLERILECLGVGGLYEVGYILVPQPEYNREILPGSLLLCSYYILAVPCLGSPIQSFKTNACKSLPR